MYTMHTYRLFIINKFLSLRAHFYMHTYENIKKTIFKYICIKVVKALTKIYINI